LDNQRLLHRKDTALDLNVPITITDELSEEVVVSTALLNLASGEIHRVQHPDPDDPAPWERDDYEFSSGVLSNNGKDVEFKVDVNRTTGQYSVSANELLEVKVRAAALFAGVSAQGLIDHMQPRSTPATRPEAAQRGRKDRG
jgi:hypothetical protein